MGIVTKTGGSLGAMDDELATARRMTSEVASHRLLEILDELETWIDEPGTTAVIAARAQLQDKLRVAVVGRVNAGKSTLVNALLGRRIAPTADTECTQVVTWYRYGGPDGAEVVLRDQSRRPVTLAGGLPAVLGVPIEEVERVDVTLQAKALRSLTLIDTPGLFSMTREREKSTRKAIIGDQASRHAVGEVDAVVFAFREIARSDEVAFLTDFAAAAGNLSASAINALGVLARADEFGQGAQGGVDPIEAARERAGNLARDFAGELCDVVAVSGLLAETARTGQLDEPTAKELARLAHVDGTRLRLWERLKPHHEVGVADASMRRLLLLLGPYGLQNARQPAIGGATAVKKWLDERAGVNVLEELLQRRFGKRADAVKTHRALAVLDRLVENPDLDPAHRQRLARMLEQLRFEPAMHRLNELRATELLRRQPDVPGRLVEVLEGFLAGRPAAEVLGIASSDRAALRDASLRGAEWAQGLAATARTVLLNPEVAEAARVASRSFLLLAEQLQH